jgi:GH18 family chitinase
VSRLALRNVDLINVMTYDLYGSWHNKIGHHSALFHRPGETGMERELNTVRNTRAACSHDASVCLEQFHVQLARGGLRT